MKKVSGYRAMGSICRQRAVFDPEHSWKHLGDAEHWEHLAEAEISSHFNECNTTSSSDLSSSDLNSSDLAKSVAAQSANDTRWKAIATA
jgi:hypothetical protein